MRRLLLLLASLALPVTAQETMLRETYDAKTDTHVEVLALFSKPSPGGYFPVRVKIANNLAIPRSLRLQFTSGSGYGGEGKSTSSFDFQAPAGKTLTRDLLVPLCPPGGTYGGRTELQLQMFGTLGNAENTIVSELDPKQQAVLMSEALFTPNASALDAEASSRFTGTYRSSTEFAYKFDPKQLPDEWLAYSGFDSVVMLDRDWTLVPAGCRNAILSWVRLGGQLVIFSTSETRRTSLGLPEDTSYGRIELLTLPETLAIDPPALIDAVSKNIKPRQQSLREDYETLWPLQEQFGEQSFHYAAFLVVLVVFGILVGPVNLFVFAKCGRRHRLFVTTPLISLGASLILIALILLQDGVGGSGMRLVLMEVRPDSDQNAAFIHQQQISRTGVLTHSSFDRGAPAAFSPVPIKSSRWARYTSSTQSRGTFNLQTSGNAWTASGDWFQSRSEHGHVLSAVVSTRGRIERTATTGTLLSTFQFPIKTLLYLDEDGAWHRADGVETGKAFSLTPLSQSLADPLLLDQSKQLTERYFEFFDRVRERRGHFIAITDRAPAIDTLPNIDWKLTHTLITGPVVSP